MFNWHNYLDLADYLERNARDTLVPEAALRSAVSRAYYAAYCLTRGWALRYPTKPFVPTGGPQDHGQLRVWLRAEAKKGQEAQDLEMLRVWRNQCDYDDTLGQALAVTCPKAIKNAREILHSLGLIP